MKKISFSLMMLLSAVVCAGFQSCSDDDGGDGGNGPLESPVYSDEAIKCEFTDSNAPYESLELTESGDYILILRSNGLSNGLSVGPANAASPLGEVSRAGSESNVKSGTYEKIGEKSYELSDFGKIVISENSIQITASNGTTTTYDTTILPKLQTSHLIDQLCRSWKCVEWRVIFNSTIGGHFEDSFSSYDEFARFAFADSEDMTGEGYWCNSSLEEIIISKCGTLAVSVREYYDNTFLGWTYDLELWEATGNNEGQVCLPYDEDYEFSEEITFKIENSRLVMTTTQRYSDGEEQTESKMIYTFVENKH